MAIIGLNSTAGLSSATADPGWPDNGYLTASGLTYTAVTGDTVTNVNVYGSGGPVTANVAIYTVSSGRPNTRVGSAIGVTIPSSAGWGTTTTSIALTNGVEYTIAIQYSTSTGYTMYYIVPGGDHQSTAQLPAGHLPATWVHDSNDNGRVPYYATVTNGSGVTGSGTITTGSDTAAGTGTYTPAAITGSGALTLADATATGTGVYGFNVTGTAALTLADAVAAGAGTYTPVAITGTATITLGSDTVAGTGTRSVPGTEFPHPATISGRKVLDQDGDVFLMRTSSSWGMASNLTDAEITTALEGVASNGFNAVTVWMGGTVVEGDGTGWHQYTNATGANFWTGTPWQSSLGPAWSSVDWLVEETARLSLVVNLSICGGFGDTGCRSEWEAASDAQMRQVGVDVATRYLAYDHIVWHVMLDDSAIPSSTSGQRVQAFFDGINDTEGASTRPVRWMEPTVESTVYSQGWLGVGNFACSINCWYSWTMNVATLVETTWAETGVPVGDCEPPYDGSSYITGNMGQQVRERSYTTFIEGGCMINFGHMDWYRFGAALPFPSSEPELSWTAVPAHVHVVEQSYVWALIDTYLADTTFAPTSSFVTTGEGTGDTKAAAGASNTAALAYFPDNRTVAVDTTILTGTGNVRLRWYDPTAGTYTTIAASEAQQTGRSVTLPAAHADTTRDWVLVVDVTATPIDLVVADGAHGHLADAVTLTLPAATTLTVASSTHAHTADAITLTIPGVTTLVVANSAHGHTAGNVTLGVDGAVSLNVANSAHAHTAEQIDLTQTHELAVDDATHTHTAGNVTLTGEWSFIADAEDRRTLGVIDPDRSGEEPMHTTNGATVIKAVAGDAGDARTVVLGGNEDLESADTFEAHVERFTERHTLAATLVDPDARTVLVQFDPWLPTLTAAGSWGLEVVATAGVTEISYPSAREDRVTIDVRADYG